MGSDDNVSPRTSTARPPVGPRRAVALPEAPEGSFWLERTPLPTARRPGPGTPAGPGVPARSALAPPGTVCPKCDSPLSPSEPACPSCGLRRAMFGRFRTSIADRVPPVLEAQWTQVEAHWSDPELHERFLAQVSLCGAYAYAASRYRRAARTRKSDAISNLQLERLSRMVHAVMAVSSVRPDADGGGAWPYRGLVAILLLLVGLGAVGGFYIHKRSAQAQDGIDRSPSSITVRRGRSLSPDGTPAPPFGGLHAAGAGGRSDRAAKATEDRVDEPDGPETKPDEPSAQEE